MQEPSIIEAIITALGVGGGGGLAYKINSKAQKALTKTEAMDKRLERIEQGIDTITEHLINK